MKQVRIVRKKVVLQRKIVAADPPSAPITPELPEQHPDEVELQQVDLINIKCPACDLELEAPASDVGQTFDCPNCGKPVVVKAHLTLKTSAEPPIQKDATKDCAFCCHPLPVDAAFCVYCGTDLKTGKKLKLQSGRRKKGPFGSLIKGITAIVVLLLLLYFWTAWQNRSASLSEAFGRIVNCVDAAAQKLHLSNPKAK